MNDQTARWLPIQEAAARHDLNSYQLYRWYQRDYVRGWKVAGLEIPDEWLTTAESGACLGVSTHRPIGRG